MFENKEDEGFWIRYWMEFGRGHTTKNEIYVFLKYSDGYIKDDEKLFIIESGEWAQNDENGWMYHLGYEYGYELVEKPPKEWLHKEYDKLTLKMEEIKRMRTIIANEILLEK